jgi:subtilisin family serine protease
VDDEGNGFVDDVNGWDFSSDDNDVTPAPGFNHGTHVAGIAAARTNNGVGVAGTAGAATLMPVRFFGSGGWSSTVVARSFRYAVDNGAKILSSSYNIDNFTGDAVYAAVVQYVYDRGALYVNSAGNMNTPNPARQAIDQVLLVLNTAPGDTKSANSNYGWGMDVAAPGTTIYSTIPDEGYQSMSGTSMAAPNAAGAAALIWSAHPDWTRDQVAAQLVGSADNIDAANPSLAGLLGGGRINSYAALTQAIAPPRIRSVDGLPADGAVITSLGSSFSVDVANVLDPASVTNQSFELRGHGADDVFGTSDDVLVPLSLETAVAYGTNRLRFTIGGPVLAGSYRFTILADLRDPFGQRLDGNADGVGGDALRRTFHVTLLPIFNGVTADNRVDLGKPPSAGRQLAPARIFGSLFASEPDARADFARISTDDVVI